MLIRNTFILVGLSCLEGLALGAALPSKEAVFLAHTVERSLKDEQVSLTSETLTHLESLLPLEELRDLRLRLPSLRDLKALDAKALRKLCVSSSPLVEDWGLLGRMKSLESLSLRKSGLESLEFLRDLSKLSSLRLDENSISRLEALGELKGLRELSLARNPLKNAEALRGLQMLK